MPPGAAIPAAPPSPPAIASDCVAAAGGLGTTPVGFIKIEFEGHEAGVLAGARDLRARDTPRLMVEANARHGSAPAALAAKPAGLGYRLFGVQRGRLVPLAVPDLSENLIFLPHNDPLGAA